MRHLLLLLLMAGVAFASPVPVVLDSGTIKPSAASILTALGISTPTTVANGGTGATTLTGLLQGNGTSAFTAVTNSTTVGQTLRVTGSNTYGWGALDLSDTDAITGDLPFANLAQGSALSVLGVTGNSTADNAAIAAGTDHQVLRRSGTALEFGAVNLAQSAAVTGTLPVANGGTGAATLTSNNVLIGNGTSAVQFVAPGTSGNVLTSNGTTWQSTAPATGGKSYIVLTHPDLADGTGATLGTTPTSINYGRPTFSNSADQAANYVEYYFSVPSDLDTTVAMRAIIKFTLGGADTGTHRYVLSMASVAASAVPTSASLTNTINLDFAGDGSGASGDLESVGYTTLTSWASSLTADNLIRIRLARDGNDAADASTTNSTLIELKLEYDPL